MSQLEAHLAAEQACEDATHALLHAYADLGIAQQSDRDARSELDAQSDACSTLVQRVQVLESEAAAKRRQGLKAEAAALAVQLTGAQARQRSSSERLIQLQKFVAQRLHVTAQAQARLQACADTLTQLRSTVAFHDTAASSSLTLLARQQEAGSLAQAQAVLQAQLRSTRAAQLSAASRATQVCASPQLILLAPPGVRSVAGIPGSLLARTVKHFRRLMCVRHRTLRISHYCVSS